MQFALLTKADSEGKVIIAFGQIPAFQPGVLVGENDLPEEANADGEKDDSIRRRLMRDFT